MSLCLSNSRFLFRIAIGALLLIGYLLPGECRREGFHRSENCWRSKGDCFFSWKNVCVAHRLARLQRLGPVKRKPNKKAFLRVVAINLIPTFLNNPAVDGVDGVSKHEYISRSLIKMYVCPSYGYYRQMYIVDLKFTMRLMMYACVRLLKISYLWLMRKKNSKTLIEKSEKITELIF